MVKNTNQIISEINESAKVKKLLLKETKTIEKISKIMINALKSRKTIFLFGNGGSAADAQHIAAELVGQYQHSVKRSSLPAMAFTTNSSIITAISNDISFEKIFSRQVEAFVKKDDVIIALSTSGKSKNVLEAVKLAKSIGAIVIGFTGKQTNPLSKISDFVLKVPSMNTQRIQECHMLVGHILCGLIENSMKKN